MIIITRRGGDGDDGGRDGEGSSGWRVAHEEEDMQPGHMVVTLQG